ncbi:Ribonuclease H domain [Macleaya cordata]|uniref:Ribonuclease H domain n=1 Tax=Macleaya cordata TaxID=56857 RepID=A0A200QY74_MACCD|nr:Ribonuclease H domain [Macleaya cordata]
MDSRPVHNQKIIQCFWRLPCQDQIKISCDGCSKGNPGLGGAGIVIRDYKGETLAAMSVGLGICTNFVAELFAIILGLEWALENGCRRSWVASDSAAAIRCFWKDKVPLFIRARWNNIKRSLCISFSLVYRECNFAADTMAKRGASLPLGTRETFNHKPAFLVVENPDSTYFRFS